VRREGGEAAEATALIALRRGGVAFNATFVRANGLGRKQRVSVFLDEGSLSIGFRFLDGPTDEDSYALTHDGGGGGDSRWAQCGIIYREPWIAAVLRLKDQRLHRFKPVWSSTDSMWTISLWPAFETRVSSGSELPASATGIYRYLRGDDVVYIGRGVIRSRFNSPERREWDFDTIEYSLLPADQQPHWESFWLDNHVAQYGRLPVYNRIAGVGRAGSGEV
jgi:hypothetical protein